MSSLRVSTFSFLLKYHSPEIQNIWEAIDQKRRTAAGTPVAYLPRVGGRHIFSPFSYRWSVFFSKKIKIRGPIFSSEPGGCQISGRMGQPQRGRIRRPLQGNPPQAWVGFLVFFSIKKPFFSHSVAKIFIAAVKTERDLEMRRREVEYGWMLRDHPNVTQTLAGIFSPHHPSEF